MSEATGGGVLGLAGQVALITGAAHGQGRATALAMAREGVHVAALDVARPLAYPGYPMGARPTTSRAWPACRALGVECLTFAADVRDDRSGLPPRSRWWRTTSAASTSCSTTRASAATAWHTS